MKKQIFSKLFLLLGIVCFVGLIATQASAISLKNGPVWGHLSDWTAIETTRGAAAGDINGDGIVGAGETWNPTGGIGIDKGIAIASMDQFYNADLSETYWNSSDAEKMTIIQYGQVFEGMDGLGNAYFQGGGRVDMYLDSGPVTQFNASDQAGLTYLAGVGQFPNMNDDILWLTGTYAPLFVDANTNGFRDLGETLIDFDGDGTYSTYTVNFDGIFGGGIGSASGHIDVTGGSFYQSIEQGFLGSWAGGTYDMSFSAELDNTGDYGSVQGWQTRSSDPVYFNVVPEPGTLLLLGFGLLGIAGFSRKKVM